MPVRTWRLKAHMRAAAALMYNDDARYKFPMPAGEFAANMSIPTDKRIVAGKSVQISTFDDGESVLLDLDAERYYSLNATGSRMWLALTSAASVEEAYAALLEAYDVPPDELRRDLDALIAELVEHRLAEVHDA